MSAASQLNRRSGNEIRKFLLENFGERFDRSERRPEFVRNGVQELALHQIEFFELVVSGFQLGPGFFEVVPHGTLFFQDDSEMAHHLVDGHGQLTHFIVFPGRRLAGEIACLDTAGKLQEVVDCIIP